MKNSTHPLRLIDSNNWKAKNTIPRIATTSFVHIYNSYLGLLGLAMMGYSAYLIHTHNSPFAGLLMGISSYMVLTAFCGLILPYILGASKPAAIAWWCMNGLLGLFCLGLFIASFFPAFFQTAIRMDAGAKERENAGIFFLKQGNALSVFTILGAALSAAASGCLAWLYRDWQQDPQMVQKNVRATTDNLQAYRANRHHHPTDDVEAARGNTNRRDVEMERQTRPVY